MILGGLSLVLVRYLIKQIFLKSLVSKRKIATRLILIGKNKSEIEKYSDWIFTNKQFGFKVVGKVDCAELNFEWVHNFDKVLHTSSASQVLLLPGMEREKHFGRFVNYVQDLSIHINWIPLDSGNFGYWELPVSQDNLPFLTFRNSRLTFLQRISKRVFDVSFSIVALLILAPLFVFISFIILLFDGWPILFFQRRIGKDGKPFRLIKFRTMVRDADIQNFANLNSESGNAILFKLTDDPRITKTGRVLRRYSLDELPQFINVVKNNMSVVGPRPALLREVNKYDSLYARRLLAKPGITGPWQVGGRSDLDLQTSIALDLNYLANWSFSGDLLLVFKTIKSIFSGQGAY